jgi:NitT/TauT family transport system substrate-binding protein
MSCDYVAGNAAVVQELANAFVKTLKFIGSSDAAAIADRCAQTMPAATSPCTSLIGSSKGMFTDDGVMDAAGAKNALEVLGSFSPSVKPKKSTIDISKTYTSKFAKSAAA